MQVYSLERLGSSANWAMTATFYIFFFFFNLLLQDVQQTTKYIDTKKWTYIYTLPVRINGVVLNQKQGYYL
jgi:hypothetical protein